MAIHEVNNPKLAKLFLQVHVDVNQGDPNFIQPLDKDINDIFDREKNKSFRFGDAKRWLLMDENGKAIGRIAAFTHSKYINKGDTFPVGGMGFFDCRNNQEEANMLFDTAKAWLISQGMEAMDGPINFGERDSWWGLLVEGFEPPMYTMNYNPPYYEALFENYGFQNFYNQMAWAIPIASENEQLDPKFYEAHKKFAPDPDYSAGTIGKKDADRFANDFCEVYNKAWAQHEGNKSLDKKQALKIFYAMKPVMDENLGWFAYHKGKPVAMFLSMPDINQIIRHLGGKFNLLSKLEFAYRRWRKGITRINCIVFGVVPEFQGSGIDYYMIVEAEKRFKAKTQYREAELQWQGDFNPKMIQICKNLGSEQKRRLVTYRYLFDREMEFKRHPLVGV